MDTQDPSIKGKLETEERLQSFYNSDTLSDVTIRFSGHEIKAHKLNLCIHSRVLGKMLTGSFKEASESAVELHDDNPQAVEGMIRHFYGLDPMSPCMASMPSAADQPSEGKDTFIKLKHIVHLYIAADKYDVPILQKEMLARFKALAPFNWKSMWENTDLPSLLAIIYNNTVSKDPLRKTTLGLSLKNLDYFRKSNPTVFQDLIEIVPDFASDILLEAKFAEPPFPTAYLDLYTTDPGRDTQWALHLAAKDNDINLCSIFVKRWGVDLNGGDDNDTTPLHLAAYYGHGALVKWLVQGNGRQQVDVNSRCKDDNYPTPLAWARYAGHDSIVQYLTAMGGRET